MKIPAPRRSESLPQRVNPSSAPRGNFAHLRAQVIAHAVVIGAERIAFCEQRREFHVGAEPQQGKPLTDGENGGAGQQAAGQCDPLGAGDSALHRKEPRSRNEPLASAVNGPVKRHDALAAVSRAIHASPVAAGVFGAIQPSRMKSPPVTRSERRTISDGMVADSLAKKAAAGGLGRKLPTAVRSAEISAALARR